ncbi:DUF2510 domain-containing protein [Mycobacterium sp. Marseille-P9652]|uniref:DUF2510 domain-containing protein n=1 Tax=Mycobacterium sp. Marseille-P9652 TaxID=2654950 RepID=UPI0012E8579F|nr:DUF2510 domain-containing protein [Mycobacterium sp. Marseille-P9652]
MLSGAINSLVWILILIAVIAVVVAVVRAAARPRESTVVEQPVVRQAPPVATSGLAPGWYPDQQDPSLMRYYDGRVWTAQTQPHT